MPIRPDISSVLICKCYQQTTQLGKELRTGYANRGIYINAYVLLSSVNELKLAEHFIIFTDKFNNTKA